MAKERNRPEADIVYKRLAELGWTIGNLARNCGYSEIHIYGLISGTQRSKQARAKVEAALGVVIWGDSGFVRAKLVDDCGTFPKGTIIVIPESTARLLAIGGQK